MTTFDQVLKLAQQLRPADQVRLRAALAQAEAIAHTAHLARNQGAIAMLEAWAAADEADDGDEPWATMLQTLDRHRESARPLYPDLHPDAAEQRA